MPVSEIMHAISRLPPAPRDDAEPPWRKPAPVDGEELDELDHPVLHTRPTLVEPQSRKWPPSPGPGFIDLLPPPPGLSRPQQQNLTHLAPQPEPLITTALVPDRAHVQAQLAEATRGPAQTALELSDWTADFVYSLCNDVYHPDITHASSFTASTTFCRFVHQTMAATSTSPTNLCLALWYARRLIAHARGPCGPARVESDAFGEQGSINDLIADFELPDLHRRLFTVALALANKWLDDNTFTAKTWCEVTGISIASQRVTETCALRIFKYDLAVPETEWTQFLYGLRARAHAEVAAVKAPGGARLQRKVIALLENQLYTPHTRSPTPLYEDAVYDAEYVDYDEEVGEDEMEIDLDEDGPLRDEFKHKRLSLSHHNCPQCQPLRERAFSASTNGSHVQTEVHMSGPEAYADAMCLRGQEHMGRERKKETGDARKNLPEPAEWNATLDEPVHRDYERPRYEAIAPPSKTSSVAISNLLQQSVRASAQHFPAPYPLSVGISQNVNPYARAHAPPSYSFYHHVGQPQGRVQSQHEEWPGDLLRYGGDSKPSRASHEFVQVPAYYKEYAHQQQQQRQREVGWPVKAEADTAATWKRWSVERSAAADGSAWI